MAPKPSRVRANQDRQRHTPLARSGGHRAPPASSRPALKTREETTNGIWRLPALKPKSATQSGQRAITSTPNIILDRCPRIQKQRKSPCYDGRVREYIDRGSADSEKGLHLFHQSMLERSPVVTKALVEQWAR